MGSIVSDDQSQLVNCEVLSRRAMLSVNQSSRILIKLNAD